MMIDLDDPEFTLNESELSRRMKLLNSILNHFWDRWKGEYLLVLREAHRYHGGNSDAVSPSVGDVVVVEEEGQSRYHWKLANVDRLITGRDGRIRGAVLHFPSNKGLKTLQRPLQRLFPLEVTSSSKHTEGSQEEFTEHSSCAQEGSPPYTLDMNTISVNSQDDSSVTTDFHRTRTRPSRTAAREARDRLAACALSELDFFLLFQVSYSDDTK